MMRSLAVGLLAAALFVALAVPASAHPRVELDPTVPTDATFAATDNVEYLGRFPEHSGNAGGRVLGDRFYLTDPRGVYVYDVSTPESPDLLGSITLLQDSTGVALAQEDPDTNGEILLVDAIDPSNPATSSALQVVDVSDPANMQVLSTLDVTDHTWNCVTAGDNSCAYAYGRTGHIVDLTDPSNPTLLDETWRNAVGYGDRSNDPYTHDLTEIRPGLVLSAGSTNILMDTSDPANPVELTRVWQPGRFSRLGYHSVEWANGGSDPIAIFGTEIAPSSGASDLAGSDCQGENSVVESWDASGIVEGLAAYEAGASVAEAFGNRTFTKLDAFDAGDRGIFLDGQAPGHVLYCAHWMELHPAFDGGGKMVVSYYDRGTRFVEVAADGSMQEIGWITPAEGYSGSAQWISNDVVYIMDYRRGMEIVKLRDEAATGTYRHTNDVIAAGSTVELASTEGDAGMTSQALWLVMGLVLVGLDRWRRRWGASAE